MPGSLLLLALASLRGGGGDGGKGTAGVVAGTPLGSERVRRSKYWVASAATAGLRAPSSCARSEAVMPPRKLEEEVDGVSIFG